MVVFFIFHFTWKQQKPATATAKIASSWYTVLEHRILNFGLRVYKKCSTVFQVEYKWPKRLFGGCQNPFGAFLFYILCASSFVWSVMFAFPKSNFLYNMVRILWRRFLVLNCVNSLCPSLYYLKKNKQKWPMIWTKVDTPHYNHLD